MENGTTYIVRPFIAPAKRSLRISRIFAGSSQWFVGPASSSRLEQMNVRSSTRATSLGSDHARYELGRLASESRWNVPASTISWQRRSYSSAEPSHQCTASGVVSSVTCSTQVSRRWFFVRADVSVAIWVVDLDSESGWESHSAAPVQTPHPVKWRVYGRADWHLRATILAMEPDRFDDVDLRILESPEPPPRP